MPLVDPIDIAVLSSPVPLPGESGTVSPGSFGVNTQQNFSAMTKGSGVASPIGTGNVTTPLPSSSTSTIEGRALESGGANVGGLVKTEQEVIPTDIKFATAEDEKVQKQEDQFEDQVDEYKKAFDGDSGSKKSIKESLEAAGEEFLAQGGTAAGPYSQFKAFKAFREARKGEQSGMSAARDVKREDRKADRKARKKSGLKGKEKRAVRKAQRQQRRDAFKSFKDQVDLEALETASNFE
jgi:hypothetical protein|tara:strand:+ start:40 stop:753 length:714 start_codon:yes stop_codon:yes gene_type:complete